MYSAITIRSALATANHLTRTPAARLRRGSVDGSLHVPHDFLVRNAHRRRIVCLPQSFLYLRAKPTVMGSSFMCAFQRLRSVGAGGSAGGFVRCPVGAVDLHRCDPDLAEEQQCLARVTKATRLPGAGRNQKAVFAV